MNSEAIGKLAFNVAYNVNARFPIPVTDIVYYDNRYTGKKIILV